MASRAACTSSKRLPTFDSIASDLPAFPHSDEHPRASSNAACAGAARHDDPPLGLRFVPIGPNQLERLVALFERNRVARVTELFDPFPLDAARARWIALEPHRDSFYLALREERPVGFSMLRGLDEGYVIPSFGIFVDHESHGEGVGRALTAWTVEQARRGGCSAVRLAVYAANLSARLLYESLGFVEQGRQLVDRAGRNEEKIVMRLDFDD
jgi:GNAT superfamily N-acetyltransferase